MNENNPSFENEMIPLDTLLATVRTNFAKWMTQIDNREEIISDYEEWLSEFNRWIAKFEDGDISAKELEVYGEIFDIYERLQLNQLKQREQEEAGN